MAGISLNTNIQSLQTNRRLGDTTSRLQKSFERLSSGLRINRAADDSAGLSISESLRTDSRVYSQGIRNLNDGVSITNIAESTLAELTNIVTRITELAEQSANGTLGAKQRSSLDAEAQALSKEYFRISRVAVFNGLGLFDGSVQSLRFQSGYGQEGGISSALGGGLGAGTVTAAATYLTETTGLTQDFALSDLNRDGILDLISAGGIDVTEGFAAVRLGTGDGGFAAAVTYWANVNTQALAVGDLNGDGTPDLVTGSVSGQITVRMGKGDGTFEAAARSYLIANQVVNELTFSDLNRDGSLDLVVAGRNSSPVANTVIMFGSATGALSSGVSYNMSGFDASAIAAGDINCDGINDLVTVGTDGSSVVSVRLGNGDGTFRSFTTYAGEEAWSNDVALADLDSDGVLDLVTVGYSLSYIGYADVRLGNGDGTFGAQTSYYMNSNDTRALAVGDVNGDGNFDLISASYSYASPYGESTIRLGNGRGGFEKEVITELASSSGFGSSGYGIAAGDVNNDGVLDFMAWASVPGSDVFQVLKGDTRQGVAPLLPFSLKTRAESLQALPVLKQTLARVSAQRGTIGALQSRLGSALATLQVSRENYESARSAITDVDVASESAELVRNQILQQAASSILSQANQAPGLALKLLG